MVDNLEPEIWWYMIVKLFAVIIFQMKEALASEEALKEETVAQAHVENYALKLFAHADTEDRAGKHNK